MRRNFNSNPSNMQKTEVFSYKARILIFVLQVFFIVILLIIWFSSQSLRVSKNLWVLFFYTFPSNFLIAIVPYDPAILYFGKFHSSLSVTLVAIIATLLTETLNYSVFAFIRDISHIKKFTHKKFIRKIIDLFNKSPFLALLIAAFSPIPFYPFRFLVVISNYPLIKYLLALFIGRTPRLYLIALFGRILNIPDSLYIILFIGFTLSLYYPFAKILKKERQIQ